MINKDRIVPVTRSDLLSVYGTMLAIGSVSYGVINAADGEFSVTGSGSVGNKLCSQPAVSIDFASGVTAGTAYFVADFDFKGITVAGAAATIADASPVDVDEIVKDAAVLYKAALATGEVTITAVSPVA